MPKKLSKRVPCAFCPEPTESVPVGAYIELEVTVPESTGQQRQLFGAHADCLTNAMREGRQVEADLLINPAELGQPAADNTPRGERQSDG